MTKHKKHKQQVRARMARTGESYSAARRAILGAPTFRAVLLQAIKHADQWKRDLDDDERERRQDRGDVDDFDAMADWFKRFHQDHVLCRYLRSQPADVQSKLQTVMYFGRDDGRTERDLLDLHAHLATTGGPSHGPVDVMLEKAPLPSYLRAGLANCNAGRIDIEQRFTR